MRRTWPLLILAALAAGGCGQKGPLYLPDKAGKVVTSASASPALATPEAAPPETPATPQPKDKNQDQDQNPPRPK